MNVRARGVNAGLVLASLVVSVLFVMLADRIAGRIALDPLLSEGFLFPPGSEMTYETLDFTYTAKINNLGLRDRDMGVKKSSAVRILAIGDSYTFGWGVELEDTWVKVLETNLRARGHDVEVINAGAPGAGPSNYASTAEELVPLLNPDIVLLGMLQADDLERIGKKPVRFPKRKNALAEGAAARVAERLFPNFSYLLGRERRKRSEMLSKRGDYFWRSVNVQDLWLQQGREILENFTEEQRQNYRRIDPLMRDAFERGMLNPFIISIAAERPEAGDMSDEMDLNSKTMRKRIEDTALKLERIQNVCAEYGVEAIGLSIPNSALVSRAVWEYLRDMGRGGLEEELSSDVYDLAVCEIYSRVGMDCVVVTDEFRSHPDIDSLYYTYDTHPNAAGHKLFADLITPAIEERLPADSGPP